MSMTQTPVPSNSTAPAAKKSFFSKVEAVLKRLFGSTTWEKTASSVISYIAPLVTTIVGLAAGSSAEAIVASVMSTVQSDLATLAAVIQDAKAEPGSHAATVAIGALNSIKQNMSGLLAAAEVKNSSKSAEITLAANAIIGEADALLANL